MRRINVMLPDDVDDLLRRASTGGSEAEWVRRAIIEKATRDAMLPLIEDLRARLARVEQHIGLNPSS